MVWVTSHPPEPGDLDSCVTCGLCLPVCPTFRLTGDESTSPRGRLTAIKAVAEGIVPLDHRFDEVIGFCLECRACETACPSMVPYGEIVESARSEIATQRSTARRRAQRLVLGSFIAMPWLMRFVTILTAFLQRFGLLRRLPIVGPSTQGLRRVPLPVQSARGGAWGDPGGELVTLFVGCVADVWFAGTHRSAVELLVRAGFRVEASTAQTCCGSLAAHGGFGAEAEVLAQRNIQALSVAGTIAVDVAGCGAYLKGYGRFGPDGEELAERVHDINVLVARAIEEGRLPSLPAVGKAVAMHDPCHLEHGQRITVEPRTIVRAAGYDPVDADPGGLCCGAAGLYQIEHPVTSAELGERKARSVSATGATIVASANAGCEMQLRRFLDSGYAIAHPIDLYADRLSGRQ